MSPEGANLSDVAGDEFLEELDEALDALEVVVIEGRRVLGRERVGEVDHVDPHPVLTLLAGAAQLGQQGRVVLLHLDYVGVEIVRVRVGPAELVDRQVGHSLGRALWLDSGGIEMEN